MTPNSNSEKRPLSILYISREDVPPIGSGGIHTWEVARNLAGMGHRVTVVCMRRPDQPRIEETGSIRWVRAGLEIGGKRIPLLALREWRELFRNYDVVMERQESFGGVGMLVSFIRGLPLLLEVNSPHLSELRWKWRSRGRWYMEPVLWLLEKWNNAQFRRCAASVATVHTVVPEWAVPKTHIVNWGANTECFEPDAERKEKAKQLKSSWGFGDRVVVGFAGNMNPWHGVKQFPEIVRRAVELNPRAAFLAIGGGGFIGGVKDAIFDMGIAGSFKWVGAVPYSEMPLYLEAIDVGIAPFFNDMYPPLKTHGFFWSPAKIFEYMAASKPVVTADIHPLNQVVRDGQEGVLAPEGDVEGFAQKIASLVGDENLRMRLGQSGATRVRERYQWRHHVGELETFLQKITEHSIKSLNQRSLA